MTITKVYCDHCQNEISRAGLLHDVTIEHFIGPRVYHVCGKCRDDIENYIGTAKHTKPPLGLVPRFIRDEARVKEIIEAIARYNEVGKPVPQEWLDELNEKAPKENR
jgi:hypothetical protein